MAAGVATLVWSGYKTALRGSDPAYYRLKAALANDGETTLLMQGAQKDEVLVVSVRRPVSRAAATPKFAPHETGVAPAPQTRTTSAPATTKPATQPVAKKNDDPVGFEATGLLGLEDSPVYAEDIAEQERRAKRKWWQKLLD